MSPKHPYMAFLLVFALFGAACTGSLSVQPTESPGKGDITPAPSETAAEQTPDRGELRPVQILPPGLETVEIPQVEPVVGELPEELLVEIIADMVERTGSELDGIQVIRAEAVVWNDGALGCPKPGEMYIQMLINGYWVVLEVEGVEYDYRVSDKGSFKLCDGRGGLPVPPPGDPGSGPSPDQ